MISKITIDKVKNVKHLEFIIPEKTGVYLLVGPNGAGKTTLLTCLENGACHREQRKIKSLWMI